jgi:hypothetical protein
LEAAENKANSVVDALLPRAAISFDDPLQRHGVTYVHFASLGSSSSNGIISLYPDGSTFLFDGTSRGLRVMPAPHAPKNASVSLTVGEDIYILERNPGSGEEDHSFEALIHRGPSDDGIFNDDEKWFWRSLLPLPYPFFIVAYTVVGGSQIWISTRGSGTFSFDTKSGVWSEVGDWALPFYGLVEYAPELGLWFGFTSEGRQLAACDLGAASPTSPPVLLKEVWDELELPPQWVPVMSALFPLGGGKFCVGRLIDVAHESYCRGKSGNDYLDLETFAVLTGVEFVRGGRGTLRMIRHKSRRYRFGCQMALML